MSKDVQTTDYHCDEGACKIASSTTTDCDSGDGYYCRGNMRQRYDCTCVNDGTCGSSASNPRCACQRDAGAWTMCSDYDVCSGTCGTGPDSCVYQTYACSGSTDCDDDNWCCTSNPSPGASCVLDANRDPDNDQTYCEGCNQEWNAGGSGDCTGELCLTNCCGDDGGEAYNSRTCTSGCSSSPSDDTCCNQASDCVYSGTCYSQGNYCSPWNSNAVGSCSAGSWSLVEDCLTKASVDSDGGDVPLTAGTCTDYTGCSAGSCTSSAYDDVCTSTTQLTEYYASGASCPSRTYTCPDIEVVATGNDTNDDPATTGVCTGGTGAGCPSDRFSTTPGSSGTEGCMDSNACPGGAGCMFREYYADDSADSCPGLDTCTQKTYDPDTNPNTCGACLGGGRYNIGGIANCCGDDSNEYVRTRQCDGYACSSSSGDDSCCDQTSDCVLNDVCYNNGANHPTVTGASCVNGVWEDTTPPVTNINPNGGNFTGSNETSFTLTCTDTGGSGCDNSYYKIIDDGQACGSTGFTQGSSGDVTCPFGQTCYKRVCFYSTDNAGNQEAVKQSNVFILKTDACLNRQCGQTCLVITGVCDGPEGNCYPDGGCLLDCSAPSLGPGEERRWENSNCGRTGSYKCGPQQVCSNSYNSCTLGGSSMQVTGDWSSYTSPSGYYDENEAFQITISGISNTPLAFTILTECMLFKSNGNVIFFNNWGSGNLVFSYTIQATDPEGVWTLDYCGLWSDFLANGGWELRFDGTNQTFTVDRTPPVITINSPLPNSLHKSDFLVNATVTDAWSNVESVAYRWENSTGTGSWVSMSRGGGTDFFTANFDITGLADGNYTVRVKANDTLGHESEVTVDIVIDVVPPDVTVHIPTPNTWYNSDFTVNATVTDQGSGVSEVVYRWENSTGSGQWVPMSRQDSTWTSLFSVNSVKDGLYTFRVKANDTIGNENSLAVNNVGIDDEPPYSNVLPLPGFVTETRFNISWTGGDNESGLYCYTIQYKYNDTLTLTDWTDLLVNGESCTLETETGFDAQAAAGVPNVNEYVFYFRSLASDIAGNQEIKTTYDTNTTIFIPDLTNVYAVDLSSGFLIPNEGKVSADRIVMIIATNRTPSVGLLNISLTYYNHTPGSDPLTGGITTDTQNMVYSVNLTAGRYKNKMRISYFAYAQTIDGSQDERNPPEPFFYHFTMYTHPLANFVPKEELYSRVGRSDIIGIEVRNIQTRFDSVYLELDSEYARFIESGNRSLIVDLNPQEERVVYARIYPSGLDGYTLNLNANSLIADPMLDDFDSLRIVVFMPADFPGLNWFGVCMLLVLAVLIYLKLVVKGRV